MKKINGVGRRTFFKWMVLGNVSVQQSCYRGSLKIAYLSSSIFLKAWFPSTVQCRASAGYPKPKHYTRPSLFGTDLASSLRSARCQVSALEMSIRSVYRISYITISFILDNDRSAAARRIFHNVESFVWKFSPSSLKMLMPW